MKRKAIFLFIIQIFIVSTIFMASQSSATVYTLPWSGLSQSSTINTRAIPNFIYGNDPIAICIENLAQSEPVICGDGLGGAIIAWYDNRNGNVDIYAQRINSTGYELWIDGGTPICVLTGGQTNPNLCSDGVGGIIISWVNGTALFAQRVNATGSCLWANNGELVSAGAACNGFYGICSDGDQGAILTWYDYRGALGFYGVYAQRINSTGDSTWGSGDVAICTLGSSYYPEICSDGAGGAIIAWEDHEALTIRVQRVDSDGNRLWDVNGTEICIETGSRGDVQICGDGFGGAIVAWEDYRNDNFDIYAQRVDNNGAAYWTTNGIDICNAAGKQYDVQICPDGVQGAFMTWSDERNGTSQDDIYAQRIDFQGNNLWDVNGTAICTAQNSQIYPKVCSDGVGGALIFWEDRRISMAQSDIYAQHVSDYLYPPQPPGEQYQFIPILVNAPAGLDDLFQLMLTPIGMGVTGGLVLTIIILAAVVSRKNK